jgi:integrase
VLIHPSGSKYWRFKYRLGGKEKLMALGVYPDVSLADARLKRTEIRKLLAAGQDPLVLKQEDKRRSQQEAINSFAAVAHEWLDNQKRIWTLRHGMYVQRRLEVDILSMLGQRPIRAITAPELLGVLRKIEARGALDIAHRALQTCGQIFRYAIATGRADRDIAADLRGALKPTKTTNHAYLKEHELPEFLAKLEGYNVEYSKNIR